MGAGESGARVVMLDKQGGPFRIIVQNLHEKVSDRSGTRGAGILTPASAGKEFLSGDVPPSPSPVRSLRPGPGDHRRRGRPDRDAPHPHLLVAIAPPNGSRQLTDAEVDLYNTMQVRQARVYVVHRPALRASLPGAPEPSPDPHLLLVAELRAPLPADPAPHARKSARCRLRLADPRSAGTDGVDLTTAGDPRSWRYDRTTAPGFPLPELVTVANRVITDEADALRAALEDFSNAPQPGCPWNQDDKTVSDPASPHAEGQGKLLLNARHQAMLIYVNAYDHLHTLARDLGGDGAMPLFSHASLSRVICEAAIRFAWLMDPGISSEERIMRGAAAPYYSAGERSKGVRRLPPGRFGQRACNHMPGRCTKERDGVQKLITDAGLTFGYSRDGKTETRLGLESSETPVPLKINVSELMAELLPDSPSWYNIGSSVTRSLHWGLRDINHSRPDQPLALTPASSASAPPPSPPSPPPASSSTAAPGSSATTRPPGSSIQRPAAKKSTPSWAAPRRQPGLTYPPRHSIAGRTARNELRRPCGGFTRAGQEAS